MSGFPDLKNVDIVDDDDPRLATDENIAPDSDVEAALPDDNDAIDYNAADDDVDTALPNEFEQAVVAAPDGAADKDDTGDEVTDAPETDDELEQLRAEREADRQELEQLRADQRQRDLDALKAKKEARETELDDIIERRSAAMIDGSAEDLTAAERDLYKFQEQGRQLEAEEARLNSQLPAEESEPSMPSAQKSYLDKNPWMIKPTTPAQQRMAAAANNYFASYLEENPKAASDPKTFARLQKDLERLDPKAMGVKTAPKPKPGRRTSTVIGSNRQQASSSQANAAGSARLTNADVAFMKQAGYNVNDPKVRQAYLDGLKAAG